jgi:hypothetical protein
LEFADTPQMQGGFSLLVEQNETGFGFGFY